MLETVTNSPYGELGASVGVSLVEHEGVIHHIRCSLVSTHAPAVYARGRMSEASRTTVTGRPRSTTAKEYLAGKRCPECEDSVTHTHGPYLAYNAPLYNAKSYLAMSKTVTNLTKITKSTTASAIQKRIDTTSSLKWRIDDLIKTARSDTGLVEACTLLKEKLEAAVAVLKSYTNGDEMRAKTDQQVREALVPKKFRGQDFVLDEASVLIGISPAHRFGGVLGAVVDSYQLRKNDHIVLRAPRYVHTYLVESLRGDHVDNYLVVTAPSTESDDHDQVAADLWTPTPGSPLADLHNAVVAAKDIVR